MTATVCGVPLTVVNVMALIGGVVLGSCVGALWIIARAVQRLAATERGFPVIRARREDVAP